MRSDFMALARRWARLRVEQVSGFAEAYEALSCSFDVQRS